MMDRRGFLKRALQTVAAATGLALVQTNKLLGQEPPPWYRPAGGTKSTFTTVDTLYPRPTGKGDIDYLAHFEGVKFKQFYIDGLRTRDIL